MFKIVHTKCGVDACIDRCGNNKIRNVSDCTWKDKFPDSDFYQCVSTM